MTSLPIELPVGFSPLVSVGDTVTPGFVIAQKSAPQDETVNILEALHISRRQAKHVLKKSPGDRISAGDVIAVKKNFFGKVQGTITSSIAGVILRYERDTGNLVVRTDHDASSLEINSPVAGTVTLCNNKEIVIETKHALISEGVALGKSAEGTLLVLKESFEDTGSDNALYYLDSRAGGKIVLVHRLTRDLIIKGDSIGSAGFLGMEISDDDITYLQEREIQLPVLEINDKLVKELDAWENKNIMVDIHSKAIILKE
jgi:hypothetical protein